MNDNNMSRRWKTR